MYIVNVQVNSQYREQGIATQLFHAATSYIVNHQCRYFYVTVRTNNSIARHIYEKWGFQTMPYICQFSFQPQHLHGSSERKRNTVKFKEKDFESIIWPKIKLDYELCEAVLTIKRILKNTCGAT